MLLIFRVRFSLRLYLIGLLSNRLQTPELLNFYQFLENVRPYSFLSGVKCLIVYKSIYAYFIHLKVFLWNYFPIIICIISCITLSITIPSFTLSVVFSSVTLSVIISSLTLTINISSFTSLLHFFITSSVIRNFLDLIIFYYVFHYLSTFFYISLYSCSSFLHFPVYFSIFLQMKE